VETKKFPDLTFRLSKEEFLAMTGGKEDLLPGFSACFVPEIEKAVLHGMESKLMEFIRLGNDGGFTLRFGNSSVKKDLKGTAFAIVSYSEGELVCQ
jgi:hypothetical protein